MNCKNAQCPNPADGDFKLCRQCLDKYSATKRRKRRQRKKDGLCHSCSKPCPGRVLCKKCSAAGILSAKKRHEKRYAAGLCIYCGLRPHRPNNKRCGECSCKGRPYGLMNRETRIAQGLCVQCGKQPQTEKTKWCESCRMKARQKAKQSYAKATCRLCDEPRRPGKSLCNFHYNNRPCKDCKIKPRLQGENRCEDCLLLKWVREKIQACKRRSDAEGFDDFDLTDEWLLERWKRTGGLCEMSHTLMTMRGPKRRHSSTCTIDRKDNSKGYTQDNCFLVTYRMNTVKGDASLEELKAAVAYMES